MKINNRHERIVIASPDRIAAVIADFDLIWPADVAGLPPRLVGDRRYAVGQMVWEEFDRPGAIRAFRVISPAELRVEHWFEAESAAGGTLVSHTVAGEAIGRYEAIWRDRIEPAHDLTLEAALENVEAAAAD